MSRNEAFSVITMVSFWMHFHRTILNKSLMHRLAYHHANGAQSCAYATHYCHLKIVYISLLSPPMMSH